jgi:hypothetical protein
VGATGGRKGLRWAVGGHGQLRVSQRDARCYKKVKKSKFAYKYKEYQGFTGGLWDSEVALSDSEGSNVASGDCRRPKRVMDCHKGQP